ncbi:riboflavin biosynthesis protein RibD [Kordiimonas sediminis]|uniref:Riboflavin biosynthesis protein RibD n=1 Tax=Kordiimonas sediminis TaxID=1735581 RepID=A0A919AWY8_9PROT|nr:bifunctional diaminohydroxyphosphoribosylaminopyrimidine deaminase/5-amino-6-(5-phosphoribosylamino)uracil reductase RibD [Kordiimonas sediminis]GHF29129.1 riboflavin biosynthesis protein RibD [Kordiimonas sediminis]
MTLFSDIDVKYMRQALSLARRGLGLVAPNPAVGCILVQGTTIVGRGNTKPGGRPHAETVALDQAGSAAKGSTAYVTLEPCSHTGQTGPCAQALVAAGVERVVVAVGDPDPRVNGRGIDMLKAAGIQVDVGLLAKEARDINLGFMLAKEANRPSYTLKMATSMDGRIATKTGDSKWITGAKARNMGHALRANHDAILIGIRTALKDDPDLSCRLPGLSGRSPVRIVLDSKLRLSTDSKLVSSAQTVPVWVLTSANVGSDHATALISHGVRLISIEDTRDIVAVSACLADNGLTRVLLEGGGQIHASFMNAGFVDRIEHFIAPKILGGDGIAAIAGFDLTVLETAPHYNLITKMPIGMDLLASYVKSE